jgi:hypothetical protein
VSELLARAVQVFEADPTMIAPVLAYQRRLHGWDSVMLAAWLGMAVEELPRLALCRRPDTMGPDFAEAVCALARYVGCDAGRLRSLLQSFPR